MEEIWKDIKGLEGVFIISNLGNVKNIVTNKNVRINKGRGGYKVCGLYYNGETYNRRIHRLVAEAFIPNPENKPQVHHIDENPSNNKVDNLMWVTPKEHGALRSEEQNKRFRETYRKNLEARKKMQTK